MPYLLAILAIITVSSVSYSTGYEAGKTVDSSTSVPALIEAAEAVIPQLSDSARRLESWLRIAQITRSSEYREIYRNAMLNAEKYLTEGMELTNSSDYRRIALEYISVNDFESARRLLTTAKNAAEQTKDHAIRAREFSSIGLAEAAGGFDEKSKESFSRARSIVNELDNEEDRTLTRYTIAQASVRAGYLEDALDDVSSLGNVFRDGVYRTLTLMLIDDGSISEAWEIVSRIDYPRYAAELYVAIARDAAARDRHDLLGEALAKANTIGPRVQDPSERFRVYGDIALIERDAGINPKEINTISKLQEIVSDFETDAERAMHLGRIGALLNDVGYANESLETFEAALEMILSIDDGLLLRDAVLSGILVHMINASFHSDVNAWIDKVDDLSFTIDVRLAIAEKLVENGDSDYALEIVTSILDSASPLTLDQGRMIGEILVRARPGEISEYLAKISDVGVRIEAIFSAAELIARNKPSSPVD